MQKYLFYSIAVLLLIGCGGGSVSEEGEVYSSEELFDLSVDPVTSGEWYKPAVDVTWQWQLQGDLNLSYEVSLYDVDLFDTSTETITRLHEAGREVICYFSAGSYESWRSDSGDFPGEVLGTDLDGWEGERWLDISNEALAPVMRARLDLAREKGCDGVEPDNMDGYMQESGFALSAEDQLAYNKFIANEARIRGLSVGLKNDLAQVEVLEPYYDFAVNESCHYYDECTLLYPFIAAAKPVLNAEYDAEHYLVEGEIDEALCDTANSQGIKTLLLPRELDDSFRYTCDRKD
jgi:hypothetical protein